MKDKPALIMPHARLWVDGIIDPLETRKFISEGIRAANQNPDISGIQNRCISGLIDNVEWWNRE